MITSTVLALMAQVSELDMPPPPPPPTEAQVILSACLETAGNNADYSDCYGKAIEKADERLNIVWKQVMDHLADYGDTQENLRSEQREWIAFKEESCSFYWGDGFGSMHRTIIGPSCILDTIETRTQQLETILVNLES